jgi:uroporphyrin-III C-methyltransferase
MVIGKVKDIAFRAQHAGLTNPAIIIVGNVVQLHPSFVQAYAQAAINTTVNC